TILITSYIGISVATGVWFGHWRDGLAAGPVYWFIPAVGILLIAGVVYWIRSPRHRFLSSWRPRPAWGLLIIVLVMSGLDWFEHTSIYEPSSVISTTPAQYGMPYESVKFTAQDGTPLIGSYIPAAQDVGAASRQVMLILPGKGGNMSDSDIS